MRENGRDAKRQVGELADALLRGARGTRCAGGSFGGRDGAVAGVRRANNWSPCSQLVIIGAISRGRG